MIDIFIYIILYLTENNINIFIQLQLLNYYMLNLKKNSESDIDSLVESMLRLIEYMNSNPKIKRQIFESFN